jgi:ubiquinone/menaquinone biosynthesis C-methylase UbiE
MFLKPENNLSILGLKDGMLVADFGSGSGFYSLEASKRVGVNGKIFSIDIQKELIKKLESEIQRLGIQNIECIWGDVESNHGSKLADGSVDAVIISNILFQAEDRISVIDEAKRILKSNGKVLFTDFSSSGFYLNSSNLFLSEKEAEELFLKRGFKVVEKIASTSTHYGIIFKYE